jgi:ABC-2 type transport system permease protein
VPNPIGATGAFARAELVSTLRQPRLLVVLVLGPFLVLFLFGLGYEHQLPDLATIVVGGDEDEITAEVDDFIRTEEPAGIDYQRHHRGRGGGARPAARRRGRPRRHPARPPMDEIGQNERATSRSTSAASTRSPSARSTSPPTRPSPDQRRHRRTLPRRGPGAVGGVDQQITDAREQLAEIREAVSDDDIQALQRTASQVADQLDSLADQFEAQRGLHRPVRPAQRQVDDTVQRLRDASRSSTSSRIDGVGQLDEAQATLDDIDETISSCAASTRPSRCARSRRRSSPRPRSRSPSTASTRRGCSR